MDFQPSIDAAATLSPGPEGLAEDLPCPRCQYDLRGLTVPRCPECGFTFDWQDLPKLRAAAAQPGWTLGERISFGIAVVILVAFLAVTPLILVVLVVFVPIALAGVQALFETVFARLILGTLSWRRFRAWWEGVLIGYGVCAITCQLVGRPVLLLTCEINVTFSSFMGMLLLTITAVESFLVQYWVVRRRSRQWGEPVPARRLAGACLAAKAAAAVPWTLIATGVLAR